MTRMSTAAVPVERLLLCGMAGLVAVSASCWSLLLAYSDFEYRRGDAAGIHAAARATPMNAGYQAEWSLVTRDPAESKHALEQAVRRNPRYSWAWIQLGLSAEAAGDNEMAKRDLLRAAEVDKGFDPRWALCDFYFRHNDANQFRAWAREALRIDVAESTPVLRLAWRMEPDATHILKSVIPADDAARGKYLAFLLREHSRNPDFSALAAVLPAATHDEIPALVSYNNFLLENVGTPAAVTFWNRLCSLGLLPFHLIAPRSGANLLTNADFSTAPSGKVFDWNPIQTPGIVSEAETSSQEFSLKVSGDQPENCRVLTQSVPVPAGRRFELTWQVHVTPPMVKTGWRWRVFGKSDPARPLAESGDLSVDGRDEGYFRFSAPGESLLTIALEYNRLAASKPMAGLITLRELNLRAADATRTP